MLLLDEPLNGLDPAHRRHVADLLQQLGESGRTVVVSSHVLHEVERMAPRVLVLVNGRLVAEGATGDIRALISDRPRRVRVATDGDPTPLARDLVGEAVVSAVRAGRRSRHRRHRRRRAVQPAAAGGGAAHRTTLERVEPEGDDLESVYAYLHDRARGVAR